MKRTTFALAAALAVDAASAASAQEAQIPSWANPTPANPVATDGTSLLGMRGAVDAGPAKASDYVATSERGRNAAAPLVRNVPAHRTINVWGAILDTE